MVMVDVFERAEVRRTLLFFLLAIGPGGCGFAAAAMPVELVNAATDTDGDGVPDDQEELDGTDPYDPLSYRDETPPAITAPAELTVDAAALYTPISSRQLLGVEDGASSGEVQAVLDSLASDNIDGDGCCGVHALSMVNDSVLLPPGRNTVVWQGTDAKGNVGTATQVVNVRPLVSMGKDQVSVGGATASIGLYLNGPSPFYPLEVPYVIDGQTSASPDEYDLRDGSVVFQPGETKAGITVQLAEGAAAGAEESLIVRLDDRTTDAEDLAGGYDPDNPDIYDINAGAKTSYRLRIVELNVPPNAVLTLRQGGFGTTMVTTTGGPATATVQVTDPNPDDTFSVSWSGTDEQLVDTDGDAGDTTLVFDPSGLSAGRYRVRVLVTDSGGETDTATLHFGVILSLPTLDSGVDSDGDGVDDLTEGTGDGDGDGIPDHLDNIAAGNVVPAAGHQTDSYLLECDPGLRCGLGPFALLGSTHGARLTAGDLEALQDIDPDTGYRNAGGIFDVTIHDLPIPGESAHIVVPQDNALPVGGVYRRFHEGDWKTFVEDAGNALHSAPGVSGYCPPPGVDVWERGLQAGFHCVQLTVEDGGVNDADGQVNGDLSVTGGVGVREGRGGAGVVDPGLLALLGLLWAALNRSAGGSRRLFPAS